MLSEVTFLNNNEKLSLLAYNYWKAVFAENIVIGTEIESCFENDNDRQRATGKLRSLSPTENCHVFGKSGIDEVKSDGSLQYGIETTTVGRRVSFIDTYMQMKAICSIYKEYNCDMNQRAGLHNHILLRYDNQTIRSNEIDVPIVIFKNIMNIMKRYAPELAFITSTVKTNNPYQLTRRRNFCNQDTLMSNSVNDIGANTSVSDYCSRINYSERYKFVNLGHMNTTGSRIKNLHMEYRFPDGSVWEAQIAAQQCLYAAIWKKAVNLSLIGAIKPFKDSNEGNETNYLIDSFRNNGDSSRIAAGVTVGQLNLLKERSKAFLEFLKPELMEYGYVPYYILTELADKPLSVMRKTMTNQQIDEHFHLYIASFFQDNLLDCMDILENIITQRVKADTETLWCVEAAKNGSNTAVVQSKLARIKRKMTLKFDQSLRTYTLI